jgi:hypothetical protein
VGKRDFFRAVYPALPARGQAARLAFSWPAWPCWTAEAIWAGFIAFIEPPQGAVVEKILRHCGLWHPSTPRPPPAFDACIHEVDGFSDDRTVSSDEPQELTCVGTGAE